MRFFAENQSNNAFETQNIALRIGAQCISYILHPLFIPIYITYYLLYLHPYAFAGFSDVNKIRTMIIVVLNIVLYPLMSVLLLKALGFVDSLYLRNQKDRIIPYIACGIFFFWVYTVFKQQSVYPLSLVSYVFGIFLASSVCLLANIYFKISMHAVGMGGWLGFFFVLMISQDTSMHLFLSIVLMLTGLACTSRLILNSHRPFEIYAGLSVGIATQWAAAYFTC